MIADYVTANIVNGYRKREKQRTLLVVPASLVLQWEQSVASRVLLTSLTPKSREIQRHCEPGAAGILIRYHTGSKVKGPVDAVAEQLCQFQIILTTYEEVRSSYPKWQPPAHLTSAEEKADWWNRHYLEHRGALHFISWHRIVLDEAQAIKSVDSQTSVACRSLEGTYRWAMSGTPVMNRKSVRSLQSPERSTRKLWESIELK